MEVNLAILVMAGGILSVVGLYSLGFRENRQSAEDVAVAAYADAVISPLVRAISATNVTWSSVKDIDLNAQVNGWSMYFDTNGRLISNPDAKARSTFSDFIGKIGYVGTGVNAAWPAKFNSSDWTAGLVILHDQDSAIFRIGFRASKQKGTLLASPLYYTEARFQGIVEK